MDSGSEVSDEGVMKAGPTTLAPWMFAAGVQKSDGVVKYGRRSECKSSSHLQEVEQAMAWLDPCFALPISTQTFANAQFMLKQEKNVLGREVSILLAFCTCI